MKATYTALAIVLVAATCASASFIRVRLQRDEADRTILMLQDRETSRADFEAIMGKIASIEKRQFIVVQITEDVPAIDFLSLMSTFETLGLTNVRVISVAGNPDVGSTNHLSFTFVNPKVIPLKEFEGPLELLEDIPQIRMNGEPASSENSPPTDHIE